jgi:OmpA-OmpF porin, OOP family
MNMILKPVLALLAAVTVCVATPAMAQSKSKSAANGSSGLYGVVGVGRSTIDVEGTSVDIFARAHGLTTSVTGTDSKSTGWKIQLGHHLGDTWAMEFGYMNLGTARFNNTNNLYTSTGDKRADLFNLDFVAKIPLSQQFSVLGRLGAYRWETKSNLPTSAGMSSRTDDGFDWKFGAGLQYDFTPAFGLRGSFDRFNGIGSSDTAGDSKANLLSIDAVLKF